ncbi:hypothetical protein U6G28_02485 [Actinomycetaceae bacterium MB13-C1-2]|nr:hypothetical protein U6G28_02485 [Actinomycetaceae bacterium MB13-C1-2]
MGELTPQQKLAVRFIQDAQRLVGQAALNLSRFVDLGREYGLTDKQISQALTTRKQGE